MEAAHRRGELDSNIHYLRFEGVYTENGTVIVNTTRVYDLDGTDAQQLTLGEIELRRQMMQTLQVTRKYIPGCEDAFLINSAINLGVREIRRIIGEYVFTHDDAGNTVRFKDTVARLWRRAGHKWLAEMPGVEMHSPDAGEGLRDEAFNQRMKTYDPNKIPPPPEKDFYFPYRSLIPQKLDGMLVAGPGMSVSHLGDTWTRSIMIVMVCGQAAGTAAALTAKNNVKIRDVDISKLQKELTDQGADIGEEET